MPYTKQHYYEIVSCPRCQHYGSADEIIVFLTGDNKVIDMTTNMCFDEDFNADFYANMHNGNRFYQYQAYQLEVVGCTNCKELVVE